MVRHRVPTLIHPYRKEGMDAYTYGGWEYAPLLLNLLRVSMPVILLGLDVLSGCSVRSSTTTSALSSITGYDVLPLIPRVLRDPFPTS